ncbi:zinc finger, C3HC4 type [Ancylostoma caninum]|uniref:Zinc finger, C3HC4 type n=1 Tax=Ancylostoma caninum TaxID=29170 RepID=A0A368GWE0_ANCCA|nr:zinc finger, C3HC4 type [Ancylostoma caninum]
METNSTQTFKARRAEARKLKLLYREDGNGLKSSEADNDASKPTCFFDESLLACDICLEIMHNAMNVSPCNHKFCAGCIYEWNSLNNKCPKCRWNAADITRDATLNSIIEQYLIAFPEKRRDKAQLIELDERELNHLEQWDRKRDSDEGDYDYDMDDQFFESEDSDTFEVQDEQLESDEDDGLEYSSSDRWSENDMIGSFDEDDDENDTDRQDEYISRRNLEKARMERLRREKEERDRLKELEAERSRKTSAKSKKEKSRERRCGTGGGNGAASL